MYGAEYSGTEQELLTARKSHNRLALSIRQHRRTGGVGGGGWGISRRRPSTGKRQRRNEGKGNTSVPENKRRKFRANTGKQ